MTGRILAAVLLICALLSVLVLWVVQSQLSNTQEFVKKEGPEALNFLLQSEHNLHSYIHAVRDLQIKSTNSQIRLAHEKELLYRYDVLWSSFSVFNNQFPVTGGIGSLIDEFDKKVQTFLTNTEPLMTSSFPPNAEQIRQLINHSTDISEAIRVLGHDYFINSTIQDDSVANQIETLSGYMRLFSTLLIITAGFGVGLLIRSNNKTNQLFHEAQHARSELALTVDELRSGRLEQKAKDGFIAAASHDLRQPLHALGLFLSSLTLDVKPSGQKALSEAKECAEALNKLFNSMLDLSKLDAGAVTVDKEVFDLSLLLISLFNQLQPNARSHGIKLTLINETPRYVYSDPILLGRIIRNLIENSISHSRATELSIALKEIGIGIEVTVADDGEGIAHDEHQAIFSEYYQIENPERDRSKGLGLGLSIVRRLSRLLEMPLTLTSAPGEGTRFTMIVPNSDGKVSARSTPAVNRPEPKFENDLLSALIIVIDDDKSILEAMKVMLNSLNIETVCAESAAEALEQLPQYDRLPDMILADYRLREHTTGIDVIKQIRASLGFSIPAMIITGDTSPGRMAAIQTTGFKTLHKPVDGEKLRSNIHDLLANAQIA